METIKFDCNGNSAPAYSCNKPGDNSGSFCRKEDADDYIYAFHAAKAFIDSYVDEDAMMVNEDKEKYERFLSACSMVRKDD